MEKSDRFFSRMGAAWITVCLGLAVAWVGTAIAAPVRVGIFKSYGPGRYWHTSIHTAGSSIVKMLAQPDSANLGPDLIIPTDGFVATQYGLPGATQGTATAEQRAAFIAALDTLDVVIFPSIVDIGSAMPIEAERERVMEFARTKGVISIHASSDSYGTWAAWDSLEAARFSNHPSSDRPATVHLDYAASCDPSLGFLNRGLPDTARFLEEWYSFTTTSDVIRSKPGLYVTVRIDESSYGDSTNSTPLGGATSMGSDHPLSWYRTAEEGGRFFYTAVGHRAQGYTGADNPGYPGTNFFRRQLYNAILWAAKVDSTGNVSTTAINTGKIENRSPSRFADHARLALSGGTLTVTLLRDGAHTVEIRALDGRRVALRTTTQRGEIAFSGLPSGVHLVAIRTAEGTTTRLVNVP